MTDGIAAWLEPLDPLPLECDGLTRAVSTLLLREGIEHRVCVGELEVSGVGLIPLHFWVELASGAVCDFRARMWLGGAAEVPHGVFVPDEGQHRYTVHSEIDGAVTPSLFHILTGTALAAYPAYVHARPALEP